MTPAIVSKSRASITIAVTGSRRHHRGRPPVMLHDRDLAEEVAGPEIRDVLAVLRDGDRPLLDHEELVRQAALLEQVVPGGHVDLVRPPRDLLALLAGQVAEQRERFQALRVHRFLLSWRASCHGRASAATRIRSRHRAVARLGDGGVPERTNGTASKAVRGLNRPSRVQITPPPRVQRAGLRARPFPFGAYHGWHMRTPRVFRVLIGAALVAAIVLSAAPGARGHPGGPLRDRRLRDARRPPGADRTRVPGERRGEPAVRRLDPARPGPGGRRPPPGERDRASRDERRHRRRRLRPAGARGGPRSPRVAGDREGARVRIATRTTRASARAPIDTTTRR